MVFYPEYDAASFITGQDKMGMLCRNPITFISDREIELKKASKFAASSENKCPVNWDWSRVEANGARMGSKLYFILPETQWKNDAEAAVKVHGRTLPMTLYSLDKLTFVEPYSPSIKQA